jgi:Fe-S oxidoreductase
MTHVEAGRPIVGLEPACLLMLRDEWKALRLGDDAVKLAPHVLLLEEFLAREALPVSLPFQPGNETVLVHGHCHQNAAGAMKSMRKLLKTVPALEFDFIDAACCGMAGSFGLEAEHAGLSRAMAEQSLLPALRNQPAKTVISNAFSCSHQMQNGAARSSLHLAQWLRKRLQPEGRQS